MADCAARAPNGEHEHIARAAPCASEPTLVVAAFLGIKTDVPRVSWPMMTAAFAVAILTALVFVVLASLGPAWRAASVEPSVAMKGE
jgi:ABC-type lipoprotein release transport system permease subunit